MVPSHTIFDLTTRTGRLFEVLTHSIPGFVWLADRHGQVEFVNAAWVEFSGLTLEESLATGWFKAVHPADAERIRAVLPPQAEEGSSTSEIQVRFRRADGGYRWHMVKANPVADGYWVGCSSDIHEQVVGQQKDRAQIAILDMVASAAPVEEVLDALCRFGEEQLSGCRCTIILLNEDGTEFTSRAAGFFPDGLRAALAGTKVATGVGSCGTAAYERRDVVSANILTDPLWKEWRHLFEPLGVRACWSRPVYGAGGKVLATLGFYFFEERAPSEEELGSLDSLRHLASVAIEKARIAYALRESEEHHRHTVEHNPQIPWTADPKGRILSISPRWVESTGLSVESALGNGWFEALHPEDVKPTTDYWSHRLRTGEPADLKYRIRLRDGSYRWVRARAAPRREAQGNIVKWYGAVEDIHDLELATERLQKQVYHDDLTRLLNRKGLEQRLQERLSRSDRSASPVSLLIVDIAGFRHVNDRFGHESGDATLRLFGRHLRDCLRNEDVVARIAGDEFAVMLGDAVDDTKLEKQASKLASELNQRLARSAKTRNCTTYIGCATWEPNDKVEDLLRRADLALYSAKQEPHGAVKLFTPAIRRTVDERLEQIDLAKQALKSRWIVPHYQPKIALHSGQVAGAEALFRINHPTRGLLSPAAVWAAMDAPKVSKLIGDQMISLVLADLASWAPWPTDLGTISINLSTETMLQEGLARSIFRKMQRRGIAPNQVTFEITERVLIDELSPATHQALTDLRRHGGRVSLDDFGTGFASLTHLQKLPIDEIKIDKSFIDDLAAEGPNAAIVKSMISLAHNMGLDAVAEGVETAEQANLLREWGCHFAQGYYFHKPMTADELAHVFGFAREQGRQVRSVSGRGLQPAASGKANWL